MQLEVDEILDKLPSFSPSINKLLAALQSEYVDMGKLEPLIICCPVIAGRVLHIANSSFYGFSRQITSIKEATVILGQHTLKSLIYTLSVLDNFQSRDDTGSADGFNYSRVWQHSLYTACVAHSFAAQHKLNSGDLFTAAIFQHLGIIMLDSFDKELLPQILKQCHESHQDLLEACQQIIALDYYHLSYSALDYWHFPDCICSKLLALSKSEQSQETATLRISNCIADSFGYSMGENIFTPAPLVADLSSALPSQPALSERLNQANALFNQMETSFLES